MHRTSKIAALNCWHHLCTRGLLGVVRQCISKPTPPASAHNHKPLANQRQPTQALAGAGTQTPAKTTPGTSQYGTAMVDLFANIAQYTWLLTLHDALDMARKSCSTHDQYHSINILISCLIKLYVKYTMQK